MSTYAPSLKVETSAKITKTRRLPVKGEAVVNEGDTVQSDQIVLKAELQGDLDIVKVAERLGLEPEDIENSYKVSTGNKINEGTILAEVKYFFGIFKAEVKSFSEGTVEFITKQLAHIGIRQENVPLEIKAHYTGTIKNVDKDESLEIETKGFFIQGAFGVGGEKLGKLVLINKILNINDLSDESNDLLNSIVVAQGVEGLGTLNKLVDKGINGLLLASIDVDILESYRGGELEAAASGNEDVPYPIVISEGFGELKLNQTIIDIAQRYQGYNCSICGITQVRAGATRPEIIIPRKDSADNSSELEQKFLEVGASIRIIRVPNFGAFGEITELPSKPEKIPTGAKVRVLRAKLENGEIVTVPRANVELV